MGHSKDSLTIQLNGRSSASGLEHIAPVQWVPQSVPQAGHPSLQGLPLRGTQEGPMLGMNQQGAAAEASDEAVPTCVEGAGVVRKKGRPRGSKNKSKDEALEVRDIHIRDCLGLMASERNDFSKFFT